MPANTRTFNPIYMFSLKDLTGGYLPLALTLISHEVFEPFEDRNPDATLFYGHSYTGNALGCAAALASLEIFRLENTIEALTPKIEVLHSGLQAMAQVLGVEETRSCGMIGAIDLAGADAARPRSVRWHASGDCSPVIFAARLP